MHEPTSKDPFCSAIDLQNKLILSGENLSLEIGAGDSDVSKAGMF